MEELVEKNLLKEPLSKCPGYETDSYQQLIAAMADLKTVDLPMISMIERDQDVPIEVIMKGLTLSRHAGEGAENESDFYLKPDESQLQVPVFPTPRDPLNPFLIEREIPLKEVLEAHATRAAKKKGIKGKAILCGVGAAHQPRSDGVPVSIATVVPEDARRLKEVREAARATKAAEAGEGSSGPGLRRAHSL